MISVTSTSRALAILPIVAGLGSRFLFLISDKADLLKPEDSQSV
jgi:hypothetical protein